jgi:phosphotriesterase-related protein
LGTIPTATGTIDSAELGRTLAHEHVFVLGTEYQQNYQDWDEDARVADAVVALAGLKSLGIDSILDPTVLGLGRYVPRVRRVAERVGLNIVVATGLYTFPTCRSSSSTTGPVYCSTCPSRSPSCSSGTSPKESRTRGCGPRFSSARSTRLA